MQNDGPIRGRIRLWLQGEPLTLLRLEGITTSAADGLLGGWAEQIEILPGVRVLPLPDGIDALDFMGGGCGPYGIGTNKYGTLVNPQNPPRKQQQPSPNRKPH